MDYMRLKWREMFEKCSTNAMLAFNPKFHQNGFEIRDRKGQFEDIFD